MSSLASLPQPSAFVTKDFSDVEAQARAAGWELPLQLEDTHISRQTEWLASRLCLTEAFFKLGIKLEPSRVRFLSHQEIEGEPDFRFSFSHTRDRAGCWLVDRRARQTRDLAIGFDLEPQGRAISASVSARLNVELKNKNEEPSPLKLWCLREAIFKMLPDTLQAGFLKAKVIAQIDPHSDKSNLFGTFRVEALSFDGLFHLEMKDFVAAFAWATIESK